MWRDAPTAEPHLDPGLGPGLSSANRRPTDKWPGHHTHTQAGGDRERWRQTNGRIMRSGDRQRCRDNPLHCSDICRALAGISITEIYWSYLYNVLLPSNKLPPLQNLLITIWCGCYHTSWYRNIPITTGAAQLSGRHLLSEWRGWHGTGPHSSYHYNDASALHWPLETSFNTRAIT